jgi:hypothetical protein
MGSVVEAEGAQIFGGPEYFAPSTMLEGAIRKNTITITPTMETIVPSFSLFNVALRLYFISLLINRQSQSDFAESAAGYPFQA